MREIKFRGKVIGEYNKLEALGIIDENGWVVGNLIQNGDHPMIVGDLVEIDDEYIVHDWWVSVIPETVSQLVEREVYEGDILSDGEIKWLVKYDDKNHYFVAIEQNKLKEEWCIHHLLRGYNQGKVGKVVGNIYDNPELLEVEK